tara:strand:- start:1683 stop:2831 length:1149 start_codon:yes stop_codon:yes gene_type:complete
MAFFGNNELDSKQREGLLGMASIISGMSTNPNVALQGMASQGIEGIQAKRASDTALALADKQRNRTAEFLVSKGGEFAKIGNALLKSQISGKQAMSMHDTLVGKKVDSTFSILPLSEVRASGLDPSMVYQKSSDGKISPIVSGGGPNIDITNTTGGDNLTATADEEQFKVIGKGSGASVNTLAESYEPARASLRQIDLLSQVGAVMDNSSSLPPAILNALPEGWGSSPLDAYRAVANGVAQGMRVAGSGTQTENDFKILLSRAGSAGMSADARMLIQKGLRAATKRKMDLGAAAQAYQINANPETRNIYIESVKEIQDRPLFSQEERDLLQSFGPKFDFSSLSQEHQNYASQLSDANAKSFLTMPPEMQARLYASFLKTKVN